MRRDSLALRRSSRRTVLADSAVFVHERGARGETILMALNFSEQRKTREMRGRAGRISLEPLGSAIMPLAREAA